MLREIDGCVCAGEMLYFSLLQCGLRIDNMGNISVAFEPNKAERDATSCGLVLTRKLNVKIDYIKKFANENLYRKIVIYTILDIRKILYNLFTFNFLVNTKPHDGIRKRSFNRCLKLAKQMYLNLYWILSLKLTTF